MFNELWAHGKQIFDLIRAADKPSIYTYVSMVGLAFIALPTTAACLGYHRSSKTKQQLELEQDFEEQPTVIESVDGQSDNQSESQVAKKKKKKKKSKNKDDGKKLKLNTSEEANYGGDDDEDYDGDDDMQQYNQNSFNYGYLGNNRCDRNYKYGCNNKYKYDDNYRYNNYYKHNNKFNKYMCSQNKYDDYRCYDEIECKDVEPYGLSRRKCLNNERKTPIEVICFNNAKNIESAICISTEVEFPVVELPVVELPVVSEVPAIDEQSENEKIPLPCPIPMPMSTAVSMPVSVPVSLPISMSIPIPLPMPMPVPIPLPMPMPVSMPIPMPTPMPIPTPIPMPAPISAIPPKCRIKMHKSEIIAIKQHTARIARGRCRSEVVSDCHKCDQLKSKKIPVRCKRATP